MTASFRTVGIALAGFAALTLSAMPASATYFGSRDGPAIGLGTACAGVLDGVARQPDMESELVGVYREAARAILDYRFAGQKDVAQGIALYKIGEITAVARQPESDAALATIGEECADDLRKLRAARPDRAAAAIGDMCAALLDGIGRNPSADTKVLPAYADGVEQIAALKPRSSKYVRAEALGVAAGAYATALARNPSAREKLVSATETCVRDIRRY